MFSAHFRTFDSSQNEIVFYIQESWQDMYDYCFFRLKPWSQGFICRVFKNSNLLCLGKNSFGENCKWATIHLCSTFYCRPYYILQAILYIIYYIKSQYLSWVGSHHVFWLFFTGNNNKSIIYKIVDKNEVLCGQQIET